MDSTTADAGGRDSKTAVAEAPNDAMDSTTADAGSRDSKITEAEAPNDGTANSGAFIGTSADAGAPDRRGAYMETPKIDAKAQERRAGDKGAAGLNLKLNLEHVAAAGDELAGLLERERGLALPTTRTPKGEQYL